MQPLGQPQRLDPFSEFVEPESEIHLGDYLRILQERWRLIAILAALGLAFGALSFAITPKLYRANATILIERRPSVALASGAEAMWDAYFNIEYYPTQYRVLRSRSLAERVVQNLRLDQDPTFSPNRTTLGAATGGSAAADAAALAGLAQRLVGGLEVAPVQGTQMVDLAYVSTSPDLAARIANGVAEAYIDWGIETRTTIAGKTTNFLGAQIEAVKQDIQDKENQLLAYGKRADIVPLDGGGNVVLARLTALNDDYVKAKSERILLQARLSELLETTPERAANSLPDSVLTSARSELSRLQQEYDVKLNTFKPEWPAMLELKSKIDNANRTLVDAGREALRRAQESARASYQTALRQEQSLSAAMDQVKAENRALNSASVQYSNIQIELDSRKKMLNALVQQQSETGLSSRLQETRESNVRIVDRALIPGGPFRPSLRRNLSLAGGVGLLAGLALVFLLHYLDRTVKTTEEIEKNLGLSVLGVIPDIAAAGRGYGLVGRYGGGGYGNYGYGYGYGYGYYGQARGKSAKRVQVGKRKGAAASGAEQAIELLPHHRPRQPVAEAYRSMRTSLLLSTAGELKVVVVTSSVPSEGKTSTVVNLAVVLAQLGKQVLLIDGDLRKSRLHEVFRTSNRVGLVTYLTGGSEVEKSLFRSEIPGLFLMPAGPTPPNPSELLSSARMRDFVAVMRGRFDFVLFDSAPLLAVTDATLLGALSDGVVLCAGAGYVLRQDLRSCRDRLRLADVKVLGVVLNRFRVGGSSYRRGYGRYQGETPVEGTPYEAVAAS